MLSICVERPLWRLSWPYLLVARKPDSQSGNEGSIPSKATNYNTMLDLDKGVAEKERGMDKAAAARAEVLEVARYLAMELGCGGEEVTADAVQEKLVEYGYNPAMLGNAAGSIFKGGCWRCVGWRQSARITNHARAIRAWVLS